MRAKTVAKQGKTVTRISQPERQRKHINLDALSQLTGSMPTSPEDTAEFIRNMRENVRY